MNLAELVLLVGVRLRRFVAVVLRRSFSTSSRARRRQRTRAAARSARQLLPQAVPRVRGGRGRAGRRCSRSPRAPTVADADPRQRRGGGGPHRDRRAAARRGLRGAAAARRQRRSTSLDDQMMVLGQPRDRQDVNIFDRARLLATSERDLFASRLLPTRTPADVYRAIAARPAAHLRRREAGRSARPLLRRGGAGAHRRHAKASSPCR